MGKGQVDKVLLRPGIPLLYHQSEAAEGLLTSVHIAPSHSSKMVLSTVKSGPPKPILDTILTALDPGRQPMYGPP